MRQKSPWKPRIGDGSGPVYQRIAAAIIEDFSIGKLPPAARLPAQRDLAFDLGVGLGSVTKAYGLLAKRGIAIPEKGRAMFIRSKVMEGKIIRMDANIPPNLLSRKMLSKTLSDLSNSILKQSFSDFESYPYQGSYDHRRCLAAWLKSYCKSIEPEQMILCNGGQHAIWIALSVLKKENITVITDEIPFPGLLWIVNDLEIDIVGVKPDGDGMLPHDLEKVAEIEKQKGKRPVLYISPTAQNPTGLSLSNERIEEIAKVCRKADITIIEDDVYTAFSVRNHRTFLDIVPDRTFYVNSLAKILSPWFRLGLLVAPAAFYDNTIGYISTSGSKVTPIIAEVMEQWVTSGLASEVAMMTHQEGVQRNNLAKVAFAVNKNVFIGNGFHMFLPMSQSDSKLMWRAVSKQGIRLSKPAVNLNNNINRSGVRICLGGPPINDLKAALEKIADVHFKITERSANRDGQELRREWI